MASESSRLGLIIPDLDDMYNIEIYDGLVELLDRSMVVGTDIGGIMAISEDEYAALPTHAADTLYAVTSANSFRLMLGDLPAAGGGSTVYDNWIGVTDPLLTGFVTDDWEEDQNGD